MVFGWNLYKKLKHDILNIMNQTLYSFFTNIMCNLIHEYYADNYVIKSVNKSIVLIKY